MKTPEEFLKAEQIEDCELQVGNVVLLSYPPQVPVKKLSQLLTDFASQSKPQLNIEKMVDGIVDSLGETSKGNDYQIHSIRGERWITHKEIGSGEPLKQWLKSEIEKHIEQSKPEEIKPVDTKTVDAVEFAIWLKVNNHELKLDSGYRSDEYNTKLLNIYIESKK